jgi:hypothetical protein
VDADRHRDEHRCGHVGGRLGTVVAAQMVGLRVEFHRPYREYVYAANTNKASAITRPTIHPVAIRGSSTHSLGRAGL